MFSSYNHNSVGRVTRSSTGIILFHYFISAPSNASYHPIIMLASNQSSHERGFGSTLPDASPLAPIGVWGLAPRRPKAAGPLGPRPHTGKARMRARRAKARRAFRP